MSFSSDVKKELCSNITTDYEKLFAQCYGMMLFSKHFSSNKILLKTENPYTANCLTDLATMLFSVIVERESTLKFKKSNTKLFSVSIMDENDCAKIFESFGHSNEQLNLRINRANLDNEELYPSFLRGVFLSCGSITSPEKGYHLEFCVPFKNLSTDLARLMSEIPQCPITPNIIVRGGTFVLYIKDSEEITDFLTYIGAVNSAMEVMGTKAVKQLRNNVNRRRNSEIANIEKSAAASAKQINAIQKIDKIKGLKNLPDDLREIALLRLENPDMSLREL